MTENLNADNTNPGDQFDDIVADLDITPGTTIAEQRELLKGIRQRQEAARQDAGITLVAIDHLPMEAIGQKAEISLRRVMPRPEVEEIYLRINYPTKNRLTGDETTHNIFLTIGQRSEGVISPTEEFDQSQANLAFNQADELWDLKNQGILPDLQSDLGGIFDISTAIMRKPD